MVVRSPRAGRRLVALLLAAVAVPGVGWEGGWNWTPPPTYAQSAGEAVIAHASDGVLLRAEPAFDAAVLGLLPNGRAVELRTDALDTVLDADGATRWWPVATPDGDGWVTGYFLELGGGEPAPTAASNAAVEAWQESVGGTEGDEWNLAGASFARVSDPDGVNLRAEPGLAAEAIRVLSFDEVVSLRVDVADTVYVDGARWWPVGEDAVEGWVSGQFLSASGAAPAAAPAEDAGEWAVSEEPAASAEQRFFANAYVQVVTDDGGGLNMRADGAPDAERIGGLPEGEVVQVLDGFTVDPLGNPWYLVTENGVTGWVFGDYLTDAEQPDDPDEDLVPDLDLDLDIPDAPEVGIATGALQYPLESFTFTQSFGCSPYWFEPWSANLGCNYHNGIDLAAPMGTPVYAADGGVIDQAGWCDCGLGYYVRIDHGNGTRTLYGHLSEYFYAAGTPVAKGDLIASVGSTGNSTGPHVHFIVNVNGQDYDPLWYLP
jgi:murein DD-endopeptidase MepM/ murein hydrolase activator NlpD